MTILVCPLSRVEEMVALHQPARVISLLDPEWSFPDLGDRYQGRHLRLQVHDICNAEDHLVVPGASHVRALLEFLDGWTRDRPLLIHCRAGIRSEERRVGKERRCGWSPQPSTISRSDSH